MLCDNSPDTYIGGAFGSTYGNSASAVGSSTIGGSAALTGSGCEAITDQGSDNSLTILASRRGGRIEYSANPSKTSAACSGVAC
jgi:hypothetical protein